jgi:hypothetical protein
MSMSSMVAPTTTPSYSSQSTGGGIEQSIQFEYTIVKQLGRNIFYIKYFERYIQFLHRTTTIAGPEPRKLVLIFQYTTSQTGEQQLLQHSTTAEYGNGQSDNK